MKKKTVLTVKKVLLILSIGTVLLCFACVGVLLIKHQHKLVRFSKARQAYMNEKYDEAKPLLLRCLQDQYNDEKVNVMLAHIAEIEDEWGLAVLYWQRASRLNPFKPEYIDSHVNALLMNRAFKTVVDTIDAPQGSFTQAQYLLLAFCHYMMGETDQAKEAFANVTDDARKKTLGVFLTFFLNEKTHHYTIQQTLDFLKQFHDLPERFIAFETLCASAERYTRVQDIANAKKCMEKAAKVNSFIGKPMQANFLYSTGFISEAMEILEDCTKGFVTDVMGATLAECYTISRQPDKLEELHKQFVSGNNARITTGYYIDALHAYLKQDKERIVQNRSKWQYSFASPIATLAKLYAAVCADDLEQAKELLKQIHRMPRPEKEDAAPQDTADAQSESTRKRVVFNIHHDAYNIGMQYILDLMDKQQDLRAGEVAELLLKFDAPPTLPNRAAFEQLLTRLDVNCKLVKNDLKPNDLEQALKQYPNDPYLLDFASRYCLSQNNVNDAIRFAQMNLANLRNATSKQADEKKPAPDLTRFVHQLLGASEQKLNLLVANAEVLEKEGKAALKENSDNPDGQQPNELAKKKLAVAEELRKQARQLLDDTEKIANELLAEKDEIADGILYIDFCVRHKLVDKLKAYGSSIKTTDSDNVKALKHFASAEAAFFSKANQKVVEQLDKITSTEPSILFKITLLYAAVKNYDKSNETYRKIIAQGLATDIVYLNMSQNCASQNQYAQAIEYAKKAFDMSPDKSFVRETYAVRLSESENEKERQQAFDMLDELVLNKTVSGFGAVAWRNLMRPRIAKLLEARNWRESKLEAKRVLLFFPNDENAKKVVVVAETQEKAAVDNQEEDAAQKAAEDGKAP